MKDALAALAKRITNELGFQVRLCGEIEWLFEHDGRVPDALFEALVAQAKADEIALESIGREQTQTPNLQQYEFRFRASDPVEAVQALEWLQTHLDVLCAQHRIVGWRSAYHEASGVCSGLHWHFHLLDAKENYQFFKSEDEMSPPLRACLAGLLATMSACMPYFAPSAESHARLQSGADHVPTKCCWGGNNRTVALRMPESVIPLRHIEHRVCGADVDFAQSAWAILVGIHYGLTHELPLPVPCYGDANRSESDFPLLLAAADDLPEPPSWLQAYLPQ